MKPRVTTGLRAPRSGASSDLVAGCAARLQALRVVPATVDLPILVKVDQIHQELVADSADKAGWVPADTVASTWCKHSDVPAIDLASTLWGEQKQVSMRNRSPQLSVPCGKDARPPEPLACCWALTFKRVTVLPALHVAGGWFSCPPPPPTPLSLPRAYK